MDYDDPRWADLRGGYRIPYDPRKALRSLEDNTNVDEAWANLWNGLHHQGNVGEASYAAIPTLVRIHAARGIPDWNTYALAATIEEARQNRCNPNVPIWLRDAYESAWRQLVELALSDLHATNDATLVCSTIAVIAFGKGQSTLGAIAMLTEDERKEMLDGPGAASPTTARS